MNNGRSASRLTKVDAFCAPLGFGVDHWPANFIDLEYPVTSTNVAQFRDTSHGMVRTEGRRTQSDSRLGMHFFCLSVTKPARRF